MLKRGIIVAVLGKIQSGLTHQYAKIRGGVTDTSEYTAGGVSRTVYWFRNDSKRMGDYSPLGTLLMNEQAKDDFSMNVVDYVFLHEVGHDQMGSIGRTLFWAIYLSSGLLLIAGIIALPSTLLKAVESAPSTVMLPVYIAVAVGISLGAVIPFTLVCWVDETLAELFAISKIGISQYRSVLKEVKEESEAGLLRKICIRIQYPPEALIFWVARKRGFGDT
ncbi:hypothetical protein GCM10009021_30280 [Halarchaeum nitratireducens]|uniref:Peptidase M48 domain-containing protein n=1 Tax=Halarchaeum nitratireducens TaxID=489913 RepID=A0A830GE82_9EURY|nr:hypothetical protein GCM10009021_30280 [Halarchaeum nitratireducens]